MTHTTIAAAAMTLTVLHGVGADVETDVRRFVGSAVGSVIGSAASDDHQRLWGSGGTHKLLVVGRQRGR